MLRHDGWIGRAKFLWETGHKKLQIAKALTKNDINNINTKLGHLSEVITQETAKAMGIYLTDMFRPCEDWALDKAKQGCISEKDVVCSKILGERLFFDSSSSLNAISGGKEHWLLVMEDSTNYA